MPRVCRGHIPPLAEINLRWVNNFENINIKENQDCILLNKEKDVKIGKENNFEPLKEEFDDISLSKYSFGRSESFSKISEKQKSRFFFVNGVSTNECSMKKLKDTYSFPNQLIAVYSDPVCMQQKNEFDSFLQDSLLLEIENLDLSNSLEFMNTNKIIDKNQEPNKGDHLNIAMCRLKGNTFFCSHMGKTSFVLVRFQNWDEPIIILRSEPGSNSLNSSMLYETEPKDGDLLILSLNGELNSLKKEDFTYLLKTLIKNSKGKRVNPNIISKQLISLFQHVAIKSSKDETKTVIAAWISYKI